MRCHDRAARCPGSDPSTRSGGSTRSGHDRAARCPGSAPSTRSGGSTRSGETSDRGSPMLSPRTLSWPTCHSSTGTNQRAHPRGHPWRDAAAVSDIVGNLGGSKHLPWSREALPAFWHGPQAIARLPWPMALMATDVYMVYVGVVVVWWLLDNEWRTHANALAGALRGVT